jgi:hypothetical protein
MAQGEPQSEADQNHDSDVRQGGVHSSAYHNLTFIPRGRLSRRPLYENLRNGTYCRIP